MDQTRTSSAVADLSPADPEQILAIEPAFPDARAVIEATHGLVFGPDVRFTTPDGVWVNVETMPLATGVAFQVVCEQDPAVGGTVFTPYPQGAREQPAAADLARALRVAGLGTLEAIAAQSERGDFLGAVHGGSAAA